MPATTIDVSGDTIAVTGPLIVETVNSLIEATPVFDGSAIAIDLSDATEVDSAGLALLVFWESQVKQQGGSVVFKMVPSQAASLMQVSGLDHMVGA